MTYIIRNADGTIKTFMQRADDLVLSPGETIETSPLPFLEYALRLFLSAGGVSGETISVAAGAPDVVVDVSCPLEQAVDIDINGTIEHLVLDQGMGSLQLGTGVPGSFIIQPADHRAYCPAGNSILTVEVLE